MVIKNNKYASKFGKLSNGQGLEKISFYSNPKERQVPKSAETTAQLHSFHKLAK